MLSFLKQNHIKYLEDQFLSNYTSFKIGGKCPLMIFPESFEQMAGVVSFFKKNNMDFFVMGNGSNLLVSDEGIDIPVIKTDAMQQISVSDRTMRVSAGVKLAKAALFAADHGLGGMEFAHGIPGTLGGAVYMNAGAYGGEMKDIVLETRYVDENGCVHVVCGDAHDFGYRHSVFSGSKNIILEATLLLTSTDKDTIFAKMDELMCRRKEKQPLSMPSAGSVFKRPEGAFAGALIEQCGFRGYRIGDAMVSEKHCGFIVNAGNATAKDVVLLIKKIQRDVLEKTGYKLESEIRMIGIDF